MLWSKAELKELFDIDAEASGVSIDTRTLQKGDLFFGLVGENGVDGMNFVQTAIDKGASAAITGLDNLQKLGQAARDRTIHAKRIGVTGSVGKTTTKEFLATCFAALGKTHAAAASYNNHIGVPLTLARMPRDTEFGVFEIGMNHPGEIKPLALQVAPHVTIITTIAAVHLEYMGGLEAIADEKSDIMAGLVQGGIALLPADSEFFERMKNNLYCHSRERGNPHEIPDQVGDDKVRVLSFGLSEYADIRATDVTTDEEGTRFILNLPLTLTLSPREKEIEVFLPQMSAHVVTNAAAALGAVYALGGDVEKAAEALAHYKPMLGRGARYSIGDIHIMDESYNASPVSIAATLRALAILPSAGRKIAILGDMRELGDTAPELHAGLVESCAGIDLVYTCGELMKNLHDALPPAQRGEYFPDSQTLAKNIKKILKNQDYVLIKGSLSMKMKQIIEAIRNSPA